jgi:hypothetical protein
MNIYDFLDNHQEIVEQNIKTISSHISVNLDYVIKHYPQYNWWFKSFLCNPNITIEFVKQNLDKHHFARLHVNIGFIYHKLLN